MRKQDAWSTHADFMAQLVSEDFAVLGGAIGGGDSRIMLIVHCAGEHEVHRHWQTIPGRNWACSASPA